MNYRVELIKHCKIILPSNWVFSWTLTLIFESWFRWFDSILFFVRANFLLCISLIHCVYLLYLFGKKMFASFIVHIDWLRLRSEILSIFRHLNRPLIKNILWGKSQWKYKVLQQKVDNSSGSLTFLKYYNFNLIGIA